MSEPVSHQDEEVLGKAYDARLMRRLLAYVRPYRWMTAGALGLILLSSLLQLVGPLATAVALDLFIRPPAGGALVGGEGGTGEGRAPAQVGAAGAGRAAVAAPRAPAQVAAAGSAVVDVQRNGHPDGRRDGQRPGERPGQLSAVSRVVRDAMLARGIDPARTGMRGVSVVAAVYLVALVLTFWVLYAEGYVMSLMGQFIMNDLRNQIFAHLQRLPVSYYDRNPIGRLVTRVTTDVDALNELFTSGLVELVGDLVLVAGIVGVLLWLDWRLALVSFAVGPLLFMLTIWFRERVRQSFREVRVRIARINAFLQEHITGMPVVQLFGREARAYRDFVTINDAHRAANVRSIFYYAVFFPGVELITAVGLGMLLWVGGGRVIAGAISIGALIAFLQYAQRFYQPLSDLSEKYNILQAAMASAERVFRVLDTPATIATPAAPFSPGELAPIRGLVEFDQVRFSYNPGEPVLKGVSFRVEPGRTLAVVGHTGAGKSTLANLLLRFYDVDSGAVRVDGVDVRQWDLRRLRRAIALVLQDVFLFSGSIGANIRLGEEAIDAERLRWAAREVHALEFIERMPGGMEALVRERGAGLSVGQKQLIAFARALAFDPRILILDEATSSIDTETEQLIQKALARLLAGRTSIVIAHRLSTVQRADRILVLHKGEVREQGTHQELLALRGIYHRLYLLQYKEQEPASTLVGRGV